MGELLKEQLGWGLVDQSDDGLLEKLKFEKMHAFAGIGTLTHRDWE